MDMIFLLDFSPIKPDFGLFAWTAFTFIIFWLMMAKFAFGPIKDSLKTRNSDIQDALDQAAKAKEEMANLKSENEKICLLYTSPSPRDQRGSRMPSSA